MTNLFDYIDYRDFLTAFISKQPKRGWGWRLKIARTIGTQSQFVSQVLRRQIDFSLEHAEKIATILEFDSEEKEYFIYLVLHARAGTTGLQQFAKDKLEALSKRREWQKPGSEEPTPAEKLSMDKYQNK